MNFEWDDKKNKINIQKHGYSFKKAAKVFLDENRIESDHYQENGEWRFDVIGKITDYQCKKSDKKGGGNLLWRLLE